LNLIFLNKMKKENIYEETGGIRIGDSFWWAMNYSGPPVKLSIYKEKVIIVYGFSKIEFKKSEIVSVGKVRGIFSKGVRIYHKRNKNPFVIFWTFSVDNLIKEFEKRGYKINKNATTKTK